MNIADVIAWLVGIGGVVSALITAWGNRESNVTKAWAELLQPLRDENTELRKRVTVLEATVLQLQSANDAANRLITLYEDGIIRLRSQVISLGAKPVFELPATEEKK